MTMTKKKITISDAAHPYRKAAIDIIEILIEPLLGRGIDGEEYYKLEDAIVTIIDANV